MGDTLKLEIVTPEGVQVSADVQSVSATAETGEFGILPLHLPMITTLRPGLVKYDQNGNQRAVAIGAGYAEASGNHLLVLTDSFAAPSEADIARLEDELKDAETKLHAFDEVHEGAEYLALNRHAQFAQAQIDAISETRK